MQGDGYTWGGGGCPNPGFGCPNPGMEDLIIMMALFANTIIITMALGPWPKQKSKFSVSTHLMNKMAYFNDYN